MNAGELLLHRLLCYRLQAVPTEPDTRNTSKLPRLLRFVRLGQELVAAPFSSRLAPLCCLPQDDLAISHPKAGSVSPKRGDTARCAARWGGTLVGRNQGMDGRPCSHRSLSLQLTTPRTWPRSWCTTDSSTR